MFESLRSKVITIYDGVKTMDFINRKVALTSLFDVSYSPYDGMGPLFGAYAELEKGNGLPLYNLILNYTGNLTVTCQDCPHSVAQADASPDAFNSILCSDSGAHSDDTTYLKGLYDALAAQTQLADIAFDKVAPCVYVVPNLPTGTYALIPSSTYSGWTLESKSRFEGTIGGDTSFPLLFIGNTHGSSPLNGRVSTY